MILAFVHGRDRYDPDHGTERFYMGRFHTPQIAAAMVLVTLMCGVTEVVAGDKAIILSPSVKIVGSIGDTFEMSIALDSGVVDATFFSVDVLWHDPGHLTLLAAWPDASWYERGDCPVDTCFGWSDTLLNDSTAVCRIWSILWEPNDCQIAADGYQRVATMRFQATGGGVFELHCVADSTVVKGCVDPDSSIIEGVENAVVYICPLPPAYTYGGDVNGDGAGPDISDLVYLVTYMFGGGPEPAFKAGNDYYPQCDVYCDGFGPDIADLVYLVNYMFGGGPRPCTLCGN